MLGYQEHDGIVLVRGVICNYDDDGIREVARLWACNEQEEAWDIGIFAVYQPDKFC